MALNKGACTTLGSDSELKSLLLLSSLAMSGLPWQRWMTRKSTWRKRKQLQSRHVSLLSELERSGLLVGRPGRINRRAAPVRPGGGGGGGGCQWNGGGGEVQLPHVGTPLPHLWHRSAGATAASLDSTIRAF